MENEEIIWSGSPSQILNFRYFIFAALWFVMEIPLFLFLWQRPGSQSTHPFLLIGFGLLSLVPLWTVFSKWLQVKCTRYELTNQRLKTKYGIFSRKADELELYRVKDYRFEQPFFLRLFFLANIALETSDRSDHLIMIKAIRNAEQLRNKIRDCVEERRDKKRVSEVDFDNM